MADPHTDDLPDRLDRMAVAGGDVFDLRLNMTNAERADLRAAADRIEELAAALCESQSDEGRYWEVVDERDKARAALAALHTAIGDPGVLSLIAGRCLDEAIACQQIGGFGETVGVLLEAAVALQRAADAVEGIDQEGTDG